MLYFQLNNVDCPNVESVYDARPDNFVCIDSFRKCNSVTLNRGRKPSEAHLIITCTMKGSLSFSSTNTIKMIHDGGTITMPYWFVHSCEAVTAGDGTDGNQLFHVCLKDSRYVGELKTIRETPSAIKDTHRLISGTQPSPVSWQTVLNALWAELPTLAKGTSTTCPTLPSTSSNAENLTFEGVTVWRAICQALAAAGCTPMFNPVSGVYDFINYDNSHAALAGQETAASSLIVWDGFASSTPGASPEEIGIVFPPQTDDGTSKIIWYGSVNTSSTSSGISGIAGTRIDIVDTTRVEKDSSGTITNSTQMTNRQTDLKKTIVGVCRASAERKVRRYSGYASFNLGGKLTAIEYMSSRSFTGTTIHYHENLEFDLPSVYPMLPVKWARAAARIRGTYNSGTITITAGIDGPPPSPLTIGGTVAGSNPMGHEICNGFVVEAQQNYLTGAWEIYSVQQKKALTNVFLDGIDLKKTDTCGTTTTIYLGTTCAS